MGNLPANLEQLSLTSVPQYPPLLPIPVALLLARVRPLAARRLPRVPSMELAQTDISTRQCAGGQTLCALHLQKALANAGVTLKGVHASIDCTAAGKELTE